MTAILLRCSVQTAVDVLVSTSFRILVVVVVVVVVIVIVVIACIQGTDNYRSETNHFSRVYMVLQLFCSYNVRYM